MYRVAQKNCNKKFAAELWRELCQILTDLKKIISPQETELNFLQNLTLFPLIPLECYYYLVKCKTQYCRKLRKKDAVKLRQNLCLFLFDFQNSFAVVKRILQFAIR